MTPSDGLTTEEWQRLFRFKGYGNPAGLFWFIGIEERGDGIIEELKARLKFREVEDLLYSQSPEVWGHSPLWDDFDPNKLIPTWSVMMRIALRLSGVDDWKDAARIRQYQIERLGKLDGETFLADLLPLPKKSDRSWPDFWPFADWDAYAQAVLPERIKMLTDLLRTNASRYVFCYGTGYWSHFKELFPGAGFTSMQGGRFKVAHAENTTIVLTPFFSPRTGMTTSQIDLLATSLLSAK